MIKTQVKTEDAQRVKTDALVVFWPEKKPAGVLKELDRALNGAVAAQFAAGRFEGKKHQTCLLDSRGALPAAHLLVAGVGKAREASLETLRQAAGNAAKLAEKSRLARLAFCLPEKEIGKLPDGKGSARREAPYGAIAEAAQLALYHFDAYKHQNKDSDEEPRFRVESLTVLCPAKGRQPAVQKAVDQALCLAEAVHLTRDLQAHPSNKATPSFLAETARRLARRFKFSCKVLDRKEMTRLKMGSLLGVAQGSQEPPKFIVMEYHGGKKKQPPVVIVGKGITFDTGGISLKPSAAMDEMKFDMSGGAVTIGTLAAAAGLKLPVNLVGLVPATENMPSGTAIKPGDILTASNGKTIEVLNTDAEGRLILADALVYAQRYKPKAVIDLATLTGACVVALGHQAAAVVGTDTKLAAKLQAAGDATGERVWPLPLYEEFEKAVKSDVADLKNITSSGVGGGTITGAAFLKNFVGGFPWAHLDIAGTAWVSEAKSYVPKGGTGYGVRLLIETLRSL